MAKPTDPVQSFIFHDPSGKRWVRIRRTLQTASIFLGALAVAFVLSLIIAAGTTACRTFSEPGRTAQHSQRREA
jgi:hypothetical protein